MAEITAKCKSVSNYIIEKINHFNENKPPKEQMVMSLIILQRLLYICDIEHMKLNYGEPLFEDDYYAWSEGPGIRYIYCTYEQDEDGKIEPNYKEEELKLTDEEEFIIDKILEKAQEIGILNLISITSVKGGPWHRKYYAFGDRYIIPKGEIYRYYKDKETFIQQTDIDTNLELKDFVIRKSNNAIVLEKNNQEFSITQTSDDDIYFSTSQNELVLELDFSSRNYSEWQTYIVFEYLIKTIIGRYILNDDGKTKYSHLPKDFINLDKKTIIWHSDSGTDNILKLECVNKKIIRISIIKDKNSKEYYNNSVRIRTSGSNYEYYYQEFLEFFRHLWMLEQRLNKPKEEIKIESQEKKKQPKKRSLLKRFNKNNQQ